MIFFIQSFFCRNKDKKVSKRVVFVGILCVVFFSVLLVISTIAQFYSFPFYNIDPLKFQTVIDTATSMLTKCERKFLISIEDCIFLAISIVFMIIFVLWGVKEKPEPTPDQSQPRNNTRTTASKKRDSSRFNERSHPINRQRHYGQSQSFEMHSLLTTQPSRGMTQSSSVHPLRYSKSSYGIQLFSYIKYIF